MMGAEMKGFRSRPRRIYRGEVRPGGQLWHGRTAPGARRPWEVGPGSGKSLPARILTLPPARRSHHTGAQVRAGGADPRTYNLDPEKAGSSDHAAYASGDAGGICTASPQTWGRSWM